MISMWLHFVLGVWAVMALMIATFAAITIPFWLLLFIISRLPRRRWLPWE